MVVMSIEQYEHLQQDNMVFQQLKEAEFEAANSNVRYSHAEVMNELRKKISE